MTHHNRPFPFLSDKAIKVLEEIQGLGGEILIDDLEAMLREKEEVGGNLSSALDELYSQDILDTDQFRIENQLHWFAHITPRGQRLLEDIEPTSVPQ